MKPARSVGTIVVLTLLSVASRAHAASLDAIWEFDGDFTATPDSAWDGTPFGSVLFVDGVSGQAAHFDGGYLPEDADPPVDHVDTLSMLTPSSDWVDGLSVMGWIKPEGYTSSGFLSHKSSAQNTPYLGFTLSWFAAEELRLSLADDNWGALSGASDAGAVPVGDWTHVAATYDGYTDPAGTLAQGIQLYVNGQPVATENYFSGQPQTPGFGGLVSTGPLPVRIGATGTDSAHSIHGFNGSIDHISLWKGALTDQEVFDDFAAASDPVALIQQLREDVLALDLHHGIEQNLLAKLTRAVGVLEDDNPNNDRSAINALRAFINVVEAQSGKKIPADAAAALISSAQSIITILSS